MPAKSRRNALTIVPSAEPFDADSPSLFAKRTAHLTPYINGGLQSKLFVLEAERAKCELRPLLENVEKK